MLAVGCFACDGHNNSRASSGEVRLYTFTDSVFSGGELDATIGHGFNGGNNVNQYLGSSDYFGWHVGLDDGRLVVGSMQGDGNTRSNSGDVYLYSAEPSSDSVSSAVFATNSSSDSTITNITII